MSKNMARVRVSSDVLLGALHFPDGTTLYDIQRDSTPYTYLLYVEHPELPEVSEGSMPMVICPIYTKTYPDVEPIITMRWHGQ